LADIIAGCNWVSVSASPSRDILEAAYPDPLSDNKRFETVFTASFNAAISVPLSLGNCIAKIESTSLSPFSI